MNRGDSTAFGHGVTGSARKAGGADGRNSDRRLRESLRPWRVGPAGKTSDRGPASRSLQVVGRRQFMALQSARRTDRGAGSRFLHLERFKRLQAGRRVERVARRHRVGRHRRGSTDDQRRSQGKEQAAHRHWSIG